MFRQQVQSFVCVQPWRRVTFKFWKMLKNASEVTLGPRIIFFLKILNFVQSFVKCKVSLADGSSWLSLLEDSDFGAPLNSTADPEDHFEVTVWVPATILDLNVSWL